MSNKQLKVFLLLLCFVLAASVPMMAQDDMTDVYGRALPEDAAPYSMQTYRELCNPTNTQINFSAVVTVYQRICGSDVFSDPLIWLDNNFNLVPAAAESWEASEDGLTWTFKLRDGLMWSDGTPVTAYDFEASYRFMATPENAYDFVWMWQGIISNWSEAVAGEVAPEEIGYKAVDDLTIEVTTVAPFPPLPSTFFFWPPMQKKSLEEIGPNYINDPATSVSSGPFKLKEFVAGERVVLEANPDYTGIRQPILRERQIIYSALSNSFQAMQDHEIDAVSYEVLTPADFEIINADETLKGNYLPTVGDFRTDYLLMDTFNPPFNDQRVRLAFAKALDRESIVNNIIGAQFAVAAYSFLMPGFPASNSEGLKDVQAFDCPAAQQLLADAGYPNGEGFPELTLNLRGENDVVRARFDAAAASISECLGVSIGVNNMEFAAYMESLLARPTTMTFGAISYGMDYIDPANMLGVWVSTGRHSWRNEEFDRLVTEANSLVGDPEARTQMYQDAERILVEDVGGIFLNHRYQGNLFQPYVLGGPRELNAQGLPGWQWGNDGVWGSVYIGANVSEYDTYRD